MAMFRRVGLFLLMNLLVVVTLSLVLQLLGVQPYLTERGIDLTSLAVFCLIWGMGGAFISLAMSRMMAKWMMGVQIIDPNTRDSNLRFIVDTVHQCSRKAGLSTMPQVGIYDSPEVNAFATGPTRSRALVAVSTGLMARMNEREIEGVIGHEVAHIANGDMVTMTLLQGVVNAFVMFLARVLAYGVASFVRGRDNENAGTAKVVQFVCVFVFEIMFMILGSMVVAGFSRWREYRADAGGAALAGKNEMIAALEALRRVMSINSQIPAQPAVDTLKISSQKGSAWMQLFSTHPPLERRIAALRERVGA